MFAYIWGGLNEISALAAIALNKLPNAVVTLREGARALDHRLEDMAHAFAFSRWRRWRHVLAPQLAPFSRRARAAGCRWCGRSCWWLNCSAGPMASASS